MAGTVRIGVSGWRYAPWRGNFYPKGLAHSRELDHAAGIFPSIELNGSFHSLQRPSSYARWADCIRAWAQGGQWADTRPISKAKPPARAARDVYCYFDNTDKLHAPDNARELMAKPGLARGPVSEPLRAGKGSCLLCP